MTRADLNREAKALGLTNYTKDTAAELLKRINAVKVGNVITNYSAPATPSEPSAPAAIPEKKPYIPSGYIKFQQEWRKAHPDRKGGKELTAEITRDYYTANPEAKARKDAKMAKSKSCDSVNAQTQNAQCQ